MKEVFFFDDAMVAVNSLEYVCGKKRSALASQSEAVSVFR